MNPTRPLPIVCLLVGALTAPALTADVSNDVIGEERSVNVPDLRIDGALHRIMHGGDFSRAVTITPSVVSATTFGVGAVAGLRGEITILGGRCWTSAVVGSSLETHVGDGDGVEATLLVTVDVGEWSAFRLAENATLQELADRVRAHATAIGIDADRPLVFRVAAVLPEIDGHVIDGSKISPEMSHAERHASAVAAHSLGMEPGVILGFVSDQHEGAFTHRGESVHAHAVLATSGITAHVDGAVVPEGASVEVGIEGSDHRR